MTWLVSRGALSERCFFFFFWWGSPVWAVFTPVAGVEPSRRSRSLRRCSFFFSFRAFSEDSERWGPDGASVPWTLGSSDRGSFMVLPWLLVELAGRLPRGQCWSISLVLERGRRADLASASTAFLTIWSKLSSSRSRCSSSAKMKGFRLFQKYLSIVSSVGLQPGRIPTRWTADVLGEQPNPAQTWLSTESLFWIYCKCC